MHILEGIITENFVYTATNRPSEFEKIAITNFLFSTLENFDPCKKNIRLAMDYSLKEIHSFGGFTIVNKINEKIVSVAILNYTGMQGYIAENILVYLGVHQDHRNKGIATQMINQIKRHAKGDIMLHLKNDKTLLNMYEKFGFSNTIVEMRLKR